MQEIYTVGSFFNIQQVNVESHHSNVVKSYLSILKYASECNWRAAFDKSFTANEFEFQERIDVIKYFSAILMGIQCETPECKGWLGVLIDSVFAQKTRVLYAMAVCLFGWTSIDHHLIVAVGEVQLHFGDTHTSLLQSFVGAFIERRVTNEHNLFIQTLT